MSENVTEVFCNFINEIIKVFPEYEKRLSSYYFDILRDNGPQSEPSPEGSIASSSDDEETSDGEGEEIRKREGKLHEKMDEFLNNIDEISDKISEKDLKLFDEDPVILQNVSFKTIWNSNISPQTRNSIWKYLQTFCVIKIKIDSGDKMKDVLKSIETQEKVKDKKTFKNLKKLKKLNEALNVNEINQIIDENPESVNSGLEDMDQLFKNTNIGKIAQEISEDLDIENMIGGEDGGLEKLLSGDNMMNIIQKISSKVTDHSGDGNLMDEASNICNTMQGNPLFSSLLSMQGQLFSSMGQDVPQDVKNVNLNNDHNPNVTRQRLQKKLQEKNVKVDKIENKK